MILHIITSVEASSYDLETCIFLKDLLLKSWALHICYNLQVNAFPSVSNFNVVVSVYVYEPNEI